MMMGPPRAEFIERLQEALGIQGSKCTSIDLHIGVDELITVTIERYADDMELEKVVLLLEDFRVGDKLETV